VDVYLFFNVLYVCTVVVVVIGEVRRIVKKDFLVVLCVVVCNVFVKKNAVWLSPLSFTRCSGYKDQ